MTKEQFIQAIEIISINHRSEIIINKPVNGFVGNLGYSEFSIHIKNCVPSVINNLKKLDFTLSMENGLLSVYKI